ncbi:hypothetical protein O181_076623 [Austropuccinia psidii MF-1]|uniref:Uncharacterized protein n=1 Tax=Austropuccinia psidii MF-1 TaxID=1389203 RepID=A0A9Q3FFD3_9BASI|nr:hypothetical protein [Austropuccinia psidii MF-1]
MADQVHAEEGDSTSPSRTNALARQIKIIGPCHPALIHSDLHKLNILPYSQRQEALLTTAETTPRTYREALNISEDEQCKMEIDRQLDRMTRSKVWRIEE